MASRRVRRHAMGVSNLSSHDDDASTGRNTVSLIHADRLVKVAHRDRPTEPAARETRVEDRPTVYKVHDKLFRTFREPYVHKVLRSCCPDSSGLLTPEQLAGALERLHVGLQPGEASRLIARVAPQGEKVHYIDFLRSLEVPQPLGGEAVALARGSSIPGPPTVRPGGGGHGAGDVVLRGGSTGGSGSGEGSVGDAGSSGRSYWNWRRYPSQRLVPGLLPASASAGDPQHPQQRQQQAHSDALVTSLLVGRVAGGRPEKMRAVFRRLDADRDSRISKEEFARGIAMLGLDVPRDQADRLFDLSDLDGDGRLDYSEFVARFEEQGGRRQRQPRAEVEARKKEGAQRLQPLDSMRHEEGPQPQQQVPEEVAEGALRSPLVYDLARSMYGRGAAGAAAVFQRYDGTRSGRLGLSELTRGCQDLVPGITERHVAALVSALEQPITATTTTRASPTAKNPAEATTTGANNSGSASATAAAAVTDYRAFVGNLLESGLAQHPRLSNNNPASSLGTTRGSRQHPTRLLHSAPSPGEAGSALTRTWLGPEDLPFPPPGRCLSAVDRSCSTSASAASSPRGPQPAAATATSPPALNAVSQDRTALYRLHEVAITPFLEALQRSAATAAPATGNTAASGSDIATAGATATAGSGLLPLVSVRSVDLGSLDRSTKRSDSMVRQQQQQEEEQRRQAETGMAAAATAGARTARASSGRPAAHAPAHATGRCGRFWQQRYADTSSITSAPAASAAAPPAEGTFVRKSGGGGGADFLRFQAEDREHENRRRQQLVQRYRARAEAEARYSAADDASGADQGRLAVARAARQRYEERNEMYDRIRQTTALEGASLFSRPPAFHEHQLEGQNTPTRYYW
ncbi:hypothetical protein Agub_g15701 [Astrephomene gubernaculifera]|uniref:EF-hand domain-containing protein n=1 Tax=Astrephomene gubernaculifera TaxID=47775 RepID=A0AAD3E3F9_9CHLO|nr:hypothetical protein Agub_g15701 [Astrephomene gubernaculifera]